MCAFIVIMHDSLRSSPCCPKLRSHSFECIFRLFSNHPCDNRMSGPSTRSKAEQPRERSPSPGNQCIVVCFRCSKEGHSVTYCPEKRRSRYIGSSCGKVGHFTNNCRLRKSNKEVMKVKVCQRCGEEGHYSNQCTNCPNCDEDHPLGSCPTAKVTCFLCEGHDHCPKECRLHQMITKSVELQRRIFHAAVTKEISGPEVTQVPPEKKHRNRSLKDRPNVTCFYCGRIGHYAHKCLAWKQGMPQTYRVPTPPAVARPSPPPRVASTPPQVPARGQVNHVTAKEANDAPDIVLGTLLVNSRPASVLFDSGASHSFIKEEYAAINQFELHKLQPSYQIQSPGSVFQTDRVCRDVIVEISKS